jgi:hypothetical protein
MTSQYQHNTFDAIKLYKPLSQGEEILAFFHFFENSLFCETKKAVIPRIIGGVYPEQSRV